MKTCKVLGIDVIKNKVAFESENESKEREYDLNWIETFKQGLNRVEEHHNVSTEDLASSVDLAIEVIMAYAYANGVHRVGEDRVKKTALESSQLLTSLEKAVNDVKAFELFKQEA